MNFELTEGQKLLLSTVREFAEREVLPIASEIEEEMRFPVELIPRLADIGLMGMQVPQELGGSDLDTVSYAIAIEELAKVSASVSIIVSVHNSLVLYPFLKYGNEEQKRKYVTELARGKRLGAYCITEATAGSDVSNEKSTAVRRGDKYILNGEKLYITNGEKADTFFVMARTGKSDRTHSLSAFIVERGFPGFSVSAPEKKMGLNASGTVSVRMSDCEVPAENLLGSEGMGMKIALSTLDAGRIGVAAQSLGIAEGAMEAAISYSKQREQFGKKISDFQAIQWMIADMATRIEASRLLLHKAACLKDSGADFSLMASMAKLYASETANMAADRAVQIHGGLGYIRGTPVERFYRDARVTEIYEGTSEIQRLVISRKMLQ
ncbi:MAG: acyl-CoA dehydrogenase family protein [Thermoplasmata archaeon]|uniref:Acyl-CoA dehydrogenase family protein n=1 Tax=Candidatus Sysuiplasma superficiale TaxID=2823368 RepID=A0A8J7YND9_9ARCH|nr:acyl-CoA dehydrogenase family protein [Candidatus Sysuiplasma superficiale]MBX8643940.1 acyl-CoA dehydrogenase family protein [Candidatus Sysuiplasma superficiale]MCL4346328.1 acyl-CoA dehydrogenase family protein [Candidatus Thermoplasmatota archaeon]